MKPTLFIGSSVESRNVAFAVQENLEHDAEVTVWSQGVFDLSRYALESLDDALEKTDFGLFVFAPDDVTRIRDVAFQTVRDNVVFELGMFIGRLGRERSFIIMPRGIPDFHLPTDLLGITSGTYDPTHSNLLAALGPVANRVRAGIGKLGRKPGTSTAEDSSHEVENTAPPITTAPPTADSTQLVLRALSKRTMRSLSGVAADLEVSHAEASDHLAAAVDAGLARTDTGTDGNVKWSITLAGRARIAADRGPTADPDNEDELEEE